MPEVFQLKQKHKSWTQSPLQLNKVAGQLCTAIPRKSMRR